MFPNRNLEQDHTTNPIYQLGYDDGLSEKILPTKLLKNIHRLFLYVVVIQITILCAILFY